MLSQTDMHGSANPSLVGKKGGTLQLRPLNAVTKKPIPDILDRRYMRQLSHLLIILLAFWQCAAVFVHPRQVP